MITTKQIIIKKQLPFDADYIEHEFKKQNLKVLRWAIVKVTKNDFIIDAAVIEN